MTNRIKLPWKPPVYVLLNEIAEDSGNVVLNLSLSTGGSLTLHLHPYVTPAGDLAIQAYTDSEIG